MKTLTQAGINSFIADLTPQVLAILKADPFVWEEERNSIALTEDNKDQLITPEVGFWHIVFAMCEAWNELSKNGEAMGDPLTTAEILDDIDMLKDYLNEWGARIESKI